MVFHCLAKSGNILLRVIGALLKLEEKEKCKGGKKKRGGKKRVTVS